MSDVINFDDIKNKVRDKEIDDLEQYIYGLYYKVTDGSMTLADVNREIQKFMVDNNISQEKFMEIQKKLVERYGYDAEELEREVMKQQNLFMPKPTGLKEKYGKDLKDMQGYRMDISNDNHECVLYCASRTVIIMSQGEVDLADPALNDFLVSYKKQAGQDTLEIILAQNGRIFQY